MIVTENCIINEMPADKYHSDPTPELEGFAMSASLSSSVVKKMDCSTEQKAFRTIKRLYPAAQSKKSDDMDRGTVAHEYVLRGGVPHGIYEIAPFDSWRTNDAKAVKKDIEDRGVIALNLSTAPKIVDALPVIRETLHDHMARHENLCGLMMKGKAEQSGFVKDGNIWLRARFDWLDDNYPDIITDYKTTDLDFERWEKNELWGKGGQFLQAAHYRHTYRLLTGKDCRFVFVVQQMTEPYDVMVITIDRSVNDEIMERYMMLRNRFEHCLKTGIWRGVPPRLKHSYPPSWTLSEWESQRLDEEEDAKARQREEAADLTMAG